MAMWRQVAAGALVLSVSGVWADEATCQGCPQPEATLSVDAAAVVDPFATPAAEGDQAPEQQLPLPTPTIEPQEPLPPGPASRYP